MSQTNSKEQPSTECCPLGREMADKLNEMMTNTPKKRGPAKKKEETIVFVTDEVPTIPVAQPKKGFKRRLSQSQATDSDETVEILPPKKTRKRSLSKAQATDVVPHINPFVDNKNIKLESSSSNEDDLKAQVAALRDGLLQIQSVVSGLPIDDIQERISTLEKKVLRGNSPHGPLTFHSFK